MANAVWFCPCPFPSNRPKYMYPACFKVQKIRAVRVRPYQVALARLHTQQIHPTELQSHSVNTVAIGKKGEYRGTAGSTSIEFGIVIDSSMAK